MNERIKTHWEKIYQTDTKKFSWNQDFPSTSLKFIHSFNLPKTANIIDIGAGNSKLVNCLLEEGFQNITVLDISFNAIEKTKMQLGKKGQKVKWVISDVLDFNTESKFDIWHDRATFHFLNNLNDVKKYVSIASKSVRGFLTIGTFSDKGPSKCSGLDVKQYNEEQLQNTLLDSFDKIRCITEDHITPFNTSQNFLFCSFKRNQENYLHFKNQNLM